MRLLNMRTLQLESFLTDIPPYAILSHTWGAHEVTLQDLNNLSRAQLDDNPGWAKIVDFCAAVASRFPEPLEYVWVDTCCIDKTSSAELSESINSMYRWYQAAQVCYAYLEDVSHDGKGEVGPGFEESRWFTRGWTLQELIAPHAVDFFDGQWRHVGDKMQLAGRISSRTGIDEGSLLSGDCSIVSVAQKMSWAAERETTRPEDMAYCLLGIFDISMTMLYGEGEKAFVRLQEEILQEYDDNTIFAWDASDVPDNTSTIGVLATHPRFFKGSSDIQPHPSQGEPPVITNKGIHLGLPLVEQQDHPGQVLGMLSCFSRGDMASGVAIGLVKSSTGRDQYSRARGKPVHFPTRSSVFKPQVVYLTKRSRTARKEGYPAACWLHYASEPALEPVAAYPTAAWHTSAATKTMTLGFGGVPTDHVVAAVVMRKSTDGSYFRVSLAMDLRKRTSRIAVKALGHKYDKDVLIDPDDLVEAYKAETGRGLGMRAAKDDVVVESGIELVRGSWIYNVKVRLEKSPTWHVRVR